MYLQKLCKSNAGVFSYACLSTGTGSWILYQLCLITVNFIVYVHRAYLPHFWMYTCILYRFKKMIYIFISRPEKKTDDFKSSYKCGLLSFYMTRFWYFSAYCFVYTHKHSQKRAFVMLSMCLFLFKLNPYFVCHLNEWNVIIKNDRWTQNQY